MNLRYFLLALALPALLTGCGVVAAFVPPIEVTDPFGVEGQSLTTTFGAVESGSLDAGGSEVVGLDRAALTTQAQSQAQSTLARTFDDQELDLRGFSIARLTAQIGLDATLSLSRPATATFPTSFTLIRASGVATLGDEANGEAVLGFENELDLVFTRDAACDLVALSCNYRYVGDEEALASALAVSESDRGTLAAFVNIIRLNTQNTPNTGRFTLRVTADSEPSLDGFSATFTLRSGEATIKIGG